MMNPMDKQAPVPTPVLETQRLILRPLCLADAEATQELFPHWEIVRYLNERIPWPYPPDGALSFYRDVALPGIASGRQWIWSIHEKGGASHLIGAINLRIGEDDNRGFWLGLPWHNRGYMTEACEPVVRFWFEDLGQPRLRVAKAIANTASRRISLREGMRLVRTELRAYTGGRMEPSELYELTREEWLQRAGRTP